ncbi:MAG: Smr/MutS family protein [Beijerinckiaceae bacterium]
MKHPGRRRLSAEEQALWAHVSESVKPLPGRRRPAAPPAIPAAPVPTVAAPRPMAGIPPPAPPPLKPLAPIERRLRQRVGRGQHPVDGALDLHGMRQDEAHRALLSFVRRKHHEGATLVIVVTGKGGGVTPSGDERGVLKRLVPHWLADPGIRGCVIGFEQAARGHGGEGALYIRIRKQKN